MSLAVLYAFGVANEGMWQYHNRTPDTRIEWAGLSVVSVIWPVSVLIRVVFVTLKRIERS